MSLPLRTFALVTGSGLAASLFLLAAGCAPTVESNRPPRPVATTGAGGSVNGLGGGSSVGTGGTPAGSGGSPATVPTGEQLKPFNLKCDPGAVAPPAARRIMLLSPAEFTASVGAAAPIDQASTAGFVPASTIGIAPALNDTVDKNRYIKLDAVATGSATLASAAPMGLGCNVSEFGKNATCTSAYLDAATKKFFRGRSTPEDVTALASLASEVAGRSDGKTAFEYATRAMALSPKSVYATEGIDRTVAGNVPAAMSPEEMASYLSFRITKLPPTDAFIQAIRALPSPNPASLAALIDQQLMPASVAKGTNDFLAVWFNLGALTGGNLAKDQTKHPGFDLPFQAQLQKETYDTLYDQLLAPGTGDLLRLLTQNFQSVLMKDAQNPLIQKYGRPGIMAMPGFIASISAPEHTDLPKRGRALVNAFFCEGQQPPPPGITKPKDLPQGIRAQFEAIEGLPGCGGCHTRINPLAYPMERYDEIGNPRELDDGGQAIDPSGAHAIVPGTARDFTYTDMADLGAKMAAKREAQLCASIKAFEYVTRAQAVAASAGVTPVRDDSCTVSQITESAGASSFKLTDIFRDALVQTALSPRAD
ncbi:MAG: DUF1588 domain-containing protein [Polyangiaceae bacterium]|nr:DUF1588 domain-containing protein [Polyangiaceae bacterium]